MTKDEFCPTKYIITKHELFYAICYAALLLAAMSLLFLSLSKIHQSSNADKYEKLSVPSDKFRILRQNLGSTNMQMVSQLVY